jgi:hypothetical protein
MRVGITGHQRLEDPGVWPWVRSEIDALLVRLPKPLIGVSSLAAGSDQIFAEAVLKHGGQLEVVVPHIRYECVFGQDDRSAYQALLARAHHVETLGKTGSGQGAYLRAGQRVVDMSDVVIAVWDGRPAAGEGGTGDIVAYARRREKHIWHIDPINRVTVEL